MSSTPDAAVLADALSTPRPARSAEVGQAPRTDRGRRTRRRLLDAAAVVFARDGFLDTKITDIAAEAKVSSGTFYNYFETKEAIFTAVIQQTIERLFLAASVPPETDRSPLVRIETATRNYLLAYREHAGLLAILEQVATFNADFREMRREIRQTFRNRTSRGIARMQQQGIVDASLPAQCTAEALTSMVSNFCYVSLVLGEDYDHEEAVRTLTTLWARGIGLDLAGGR
ncbi:TetR/AcrR family transcriptional regulator [Pseudonocardia humida]|uniref:TetR/AcrR family transcriptional regulator n=1 Tax=Pseudonocardia humida TaxID=2800819 RepID=A0ABT1A272_9PSEU|nr:TetR/AcrR family transcriptional regulator [Pseudonocardia humida]MCO1657082.1 TetR/AcrR family transcriptional regulator [Pseudonocardia humida]